MNNDLYVSSLSMSYGKKQVLSGVSFSASAGEITCLLGKNGCGKTSLLKSVAGIIKSEGRIRLGECDLKKLSVRELARIVSYAPQRSRIDIPISVLDIVMMAFNCEIGMLDNYKKTQYEKARSVLGDLGLLHFAERDFLTLSEGEKQMVIIARVILSNSALMILDEPESSLDYKNRYGMLRALKNEVVRNNSAMLVSLHEPSLALEFADKLVVINDGRVDSEICPKKDGLEEMKNKLSVLYGDISLCRIGERLVMLSES